MNVRNYENNLAKFGCPAGPNLSQIKSIRDGLKIRRKILSFELNLIIFEITSVGKNQVNEYRISVD